MTEEKIAETLPKIAKIKEEIIGPARGGLMKRTLKELQALDINFSDVIAIKNMSINLTWIKMINLINYNAEKKVLHWNHTFEEAIEIINIFLL